MGSEFVEPCLWCGKCLAPSEEVYMVAHRDEGGTRGVGLICTDCWDSKAPEAIMDITDDENP